MRMHHVTDRRPFVLVVPVASAIFALGIAALRLGKPAVAGGAVVGAAWSAVIGVAVARLQGRARWRAHVSNLPVFTAVMATGLLLGGGLMYGLLMTAALDAPVAILSAMMQPTIPYFIVLNTLMEWLIVPAAVFANWHSLRRRPPIVLAAAFYY
jgi:hypothetical protein